jgi:Rrf2 family protein
LILGNQVEWALHCVTVLASAPKDKLLSAKALSEFHGVPKEYLSKCLQQLSQAGLVTTTTGPRGGYALAKSPHQISFLDVVEAVEGKAKSFRCQEIRRNNPCLGKADRKFSSVCEIAAVMYEADESWRATLRRRKISDIIKTLGERLSSQTLSAMDEWLKDPSVPESKRGGPN